MQGPDDIIRILIIIFMALAAFFLLPVSESVQVYPEIEPIVPELSETFTASQAFTMSYPNHWSYQIGQGQIIFGETATVFRLEPGPNITVHRADDMFMASLEDLSLETAMDAYLRRGPLRGDQFAMLGEVSPATFSDFDALAVELQGQEINNEEMPAWRAYLIGTQAENGRFYFVVASSPVEDWEADWPLMEAMLATASINE